MNWKAIALNKLAVRQACLGLVCGLWSAVLYETGLGVGLGLGGSLTPYLLAGGGLGLGLGISLGMLDELPARLWPRLWRAALVAAVLGALAGAVTLAGIAVASGAHNAAASLAPEGSWLYWLCLALLLGVVAAATGLGSALGVGQPRLGVRRALWGLGAGVLVAVPLAVVLALVPAFNWVHWGAMALWGALVAPVMFGAEKRLARRWLRVLTEPGGDRFFPLLGRRVKLGRLPGNDIVLARHHEIFPVHCQLRWMKDHYEIYDDEAGGMVFVNFRQVQEQPLKPGDLIKIGSALLQYGEA